LTYFNIKTIYGVETVDQLNRKDFQTYSEYIVELKRLKNEYRMAGMDIYLSQRATKEWYIN